MTNLLLPLLYSIVDTYIRYETIDNMSLDELVSLDDDVPWMKIMEKFVKVPIFLMSCVALRKIAIESVQSDRAKSKFILYLAPSFCSLTMIFGLAFMSWFEQCMEDQHFLKANKNSIFKTLGLFFCQLGGALCITIIRIINRFTYGMICGILGWDVPTSSSVESSVWNIFSITTALRVGGEDINNDEMFQEQWWWSQVYFVSIPMLCIVLHELLVFKNIKETVSCYLFLCFIVHHMSFTFSFFVQFLAGAYPLVSIVSCLQLHLGYTTEKKKEQDSKNVSKQSNPITITRWEWSDNNKWFPYLKGESDTIEKKYQALLALPKESKIMLGFLKQINNETTFALNIPSRGNYNITVSRSGTGTQSNVNSRFKRQVRRWTGPSSSSFSSTIAKKKTKSLVSSFFGKIWFKNRKLLTSFVLVTTGTSFLFHSAESFLCFLNTYIPPLRWIWNMSCWFWNLARGGLYLEFFYWRTLYGMRLDWWMRYIWGCFHSLVVKASTIFNLVFWFGFGNTDFYRKFLGVSFGIVTLFCPAACLLPFSVALPPIVHFNKRSRRRCTMMLVASWVAIVAFEVNLRCALSIGYKIPLPSLEDVTSNWPCDLFLFDNQNCNKDVIIARDEFLLHLPHFRFYRWISNLIYLGSESVLEHYIFALGQFMFISCSTIFGYVMMNNKDSVYFTMCAAVSCVLVPYVASIVGILTPLVVILVTVYDILESISSVFTNQIRKFKKYVLFSLSLSLSHTHLLTYLLTCTHTYTRTRRYVTHRKKDKKTKKIRLVRQISVPTEWEDFDESSTSSSAKLVPLPTSHAEYQRVETQYKASGGRGKIQQIFQVQAPDLWFRYAHCRSAMPAGTVEKWCWHGCSKVAADSILGNGSTSDGGFDWRFSGSNATCFGKGAYFALKASYSCQSTYSRPDATGLKRLFYARLSMIDSDIVKGSSSLTKPPGKFTVATDNLHSPQMYVLFNIPQSYPAYLLTWR